MGRWPPAPFVYAILDVAFLADREVGAVAAALAAGGVGLLQLRAKGLQDARYHALAQEARAASRKLGVGLVINDRPDIALMVKADGVHVGQDDLVPRDVRKVLPASTLVGLSTHTPEEIKGAAREPVDYIATGPVFETGSKADAHAAVGLEGVRRARGLTRKPLIAIGGITRENAPAVIAAGADGVAVISELLARDDLEQAARELVRAVVGG